MARTNGAVICPGGLVKHIGGKVAFCTQEHQRRPNLSRVRGRACSTTGALLAQGPRGSMCGVPTRSATRADDEVWVSSTRGI